MSNNFKHVALSDPRRQIRLITLDPTANGNSISCSLNIYSLGSSPRYTALSYEWGPPPATEQIFLNGFPFSVRQNVFSFLTEYKRAQKFGSEANGVLLFIDQLCIDQTSNSERSAQVARMGEIYQNASRTIAWLRDKEMGSDAYSAMSILIENFDELHGNDQSKIQHWQSLCRRAYWTRTWVVQELVRSVNVVVWDGAKRIQWDSFVTYIRCVNEKNPRKGIIPSLEEVRTTPLVALLYTRQARPRDNVELQTIVGQFEGTSCSDPRDTVYALLGLVSDKHRIMPNYDQDARALFQEVSIAVAPGYWQRPPYEKFCVLLARRLQQPETLAIDYCKIWEHRFEKRMSELPPGASFVESSRLLARPAATDAWNSM